MFVKPFAPTKDFKKKTWSITYGVQCLCLTAHGRKKINMREEHIKLHFSLKACANQMPSYYLSFSFECKIAVIASLLLLIPPFGR